MTLRHKYYLRSSRFKISEHKNAMPFSSTMVAPAGQFKKNARVIPMMTQLTEMTDEITREARNPLEICKAVTAGKIIRLEINSGST